MDGSQSWSWPVPSQKAVTTRKSTNSNLLGLFGLSSTLSDTGEAAQPSRENEVRRDPHPGAFICPELSDQRNEWKKIKLDCLNSEDKLLLLCSPCLRGRGFSRSL